MPTLLVLVLILFSFVAGFAYSQWLDTTPGLPAEFNALRYVWSILSRLYPRLYVRTGAEFRLLHYEKLALSKTIYIFY